MLAALVFAAIAAAVTGTETVGWDRDLLLWFRERGDLSRAWGPLWLVYAARDFTALGSATVLNVVIVVTLGFLYLAGRHRMAALVFVSAYGGMISGRLLKGTFLRERPDVVPHLIEVGDWSFPSGHALDSAVVYLTLAALLMRATAEQKMRIYFATLGILLTLCIGITRIYLGVHHPSDVLAGWAAGVAWALACLVVARRLQRRGVVADAGEREAA